MESFSLVLFFSGFFIALPAFATRPDMGFVFEPYWLYFSSIGFFLFMVLVLFKMKDRVHRWLGVVLWLTIFMFFFIQTQKLNITAGTQVSYCENWLRKSPGNTIPAGILAHEYIVNNRNIPLEFFTPLLGMVDIYLKNGHYETAVKLISRFFSPELTHDQRQELLYRTAVAYYQREHPAKSWDLIHRILHSSLDYIELSYLFDQTGADEMALDVLRHCRAVYPQYKEAYLLEGVILANQKHYEESIHLWEQGSRIDLTDERFRLNIKKAIGFIKTNSSGSRRQ